MKQAWKISKIVAPWGTERVRRLLCGSALGLAILVTAAGCAGPTPPFDAASAQRAVQYSDYATAERLYRAGADQGNSEAQYGLGRLYQLGGGVPIDYGEAVRWFRLAAAQQHLDAQYELAFLTINGQGTNRNVNDGLKMLITAAENGHVPSQLYLSNGYRTGTRGFPRDYARAAMWQRVAYCSHQEYLNSLPDLQSRPTWFLNATARPEQQLLNRADLLSPDEIATARQMAEHWIHARVTANPAVRAFMPIDCL